MPKAKDVLAKLIKRPANGPVYQGPESDGPNGGVTQGLISRWLACKERCRLYLVEGLTPRPEFNSKLDFGTMWHLMEEAIAAKKPWEGAIGVYCNGLRDKFIGQRDEITLWEAKCCQLFPRYVDHWAAHPDVQRRTPLLQEQAFSVPYKLPSSRVVILRGKWDSVDNITEAPVGNYTQENKTKSTIDKPKLERQLTWDLQTMTYTISLTELSKLLNDGATEAVLNATVPNWKKMPGNVLNALCKPPNGVRYNVVRRAEHKSVASMLEKFELDKRMGRIGEWFARWRVEISQQDVARFRRECLDPILENICCWWDWIKGNPKPFDHESDPTPTARMQYHFRYPYGTYSAVAQGGFDPLDNFANTGSEIGIVRTDVIFPELQGG